MLTARLFVSVHCGNEFEDYFKTLFGVERLTNSVISKDLGGRTRVPKQCSPYSANVCPFSSTQKAVSDVPEAPTSVYGTQSGLRTAIVSWDAPEDNNTTITMYKITYNRTVQSGGDGASELAVNTTGSPAPTSVNVTGLITGSGYTFAVRAINSVGHSTLSEGSDEVSSQSWLWLSADQQYWFDLR